MKKSKFQILSQRLQSVEYGINTNFKKIGESIQLEVESETQVKRDQMKPLAEVSLKIYVYKKSNLEDVPFKMTIQNIGFFGWEDLSDDELIDKYLHQNAPAVLLASIRSIVLQLTAFSNFSPLILPLLDFTKK